MKQLFLLAVLFSPAVLAQPQVLFVDDDGAQCPGAMRSVREAVSRAGAGSTILVCPGTYRGEIEIRGAARNGIKLLAVGPAEGVLIAPQNSSECAGFTLASVNGVLIRGFTVSGFRCADSTATQFGSGSSIRLLEDANENTIEHNRMSNTGMSAYASSMPPATWFKTMSSTALTPPASAAASCRVVPRRTGISIGATSSRTYRVPV